jgi:hypothetical protein
LAPFGSAEYPACVRNPHAGSTGRRNTGVKSLCWGFKLQGVVVRSADEPLCSDRLASAPGPVLTPSRTSTASCACATSPFWELVSGWTIFATSRRIKDLAPPFFTIEPRFSPNFRPVDWNWISVAFCLPNIVCGLLRPSVRAGGLLACTLNAAVVAFGTGGGTLNFNHTASNYVFAPTVTG